MRAQILAINDFHGQLPAGLQVRGRPVGSAGVLAAWLREARRGREAETVVVHAGDLVGASPAASSLLRDEPTVELVNGLTGPGCRGHEAAAAGPPFSRCDVVGTVGNHELDRGLPALKRLLGGDPGGKPWGGARYPTVSANLVDARSRQPVFAPYTIVEVGGVPVAFVGAIVRSAGSMVAAGRIEGLAFLDEAQAVNRWIPELQRRGVRAVVVLLHQGGEQRRYEGPTRLDAPTVQGSAIARIVGRLDPEVDLVVSAHSHAFTNAFLPRPGGEPVLVTQAHARGTAFAAIDLTLDRASGDVARSSARIVTAWADAGPGRSPDRAAEAVARRAEERVATLTARLVTVAAEPIPASRVGDSPLGLLVADAHRAALGADVAFMNPGGVRAGLPAGPVTWGALYAAHPFGNQLVRLTLTGAELLDVLREQGRRPGHPLLLHPSNLTYTFRDGAPARERIADARVGGTPLDPAARYTVAVNEFLAGGGDGFRAFARAKDRVAGGGDLEALEAYLRAQPRPLRAPAGSGSPWCGERTLRSRSAHSMSRRMSPRSWPR